MKFGELLSSEVFVPWRLSYIQYDVLKVELKTRQQDHSWNDQDESDFVSLLENELEKVYDFVNAKLSEVEARINYCERSIRTFMNNATYSSEQNWAVMDEALTEVLFDVNDLAKFTRLNYIGFQKIIKKHDKWTHMNLQQGFVPQLRAKPLDKQRFDVAIVFISSLHDICQLKGQPRTGNAAAGGDQSAFERATAKYWIHPDNITEVKSIIMLHLPVLIFNDNKPFEQDDAAISSVYFDNPDFDLYTGRLQRDEGAEAIRFRWYGPMSTNSVFIERKTHHAWWLEGASVKDRFRLDEPDVAKFVSGELSAATYADRLTAKGTDEKVVKDNLFIANGIQTSLKDKHLDPVLRAFYNRTAFQLPGDQRVRVSLDTDLTFIREDNFDRARRGDGQWRRPDVGIDYPFSYLDEADILRFPYAVLETKLQTHLGQEPPAWLTNLIDSHLVHEVPRFSKYLHGACHFYGDRMPLLPWWLSEMELDIRKPRATNFGLTRSKSFKPLIDGHYSRAMEQEATRMKVVAQRANSIQRINSRNPNDDDNNNNNEQQQSSAAAGYTLQDPSEQQGAIYPNEKLLERQAAAAAAASAVALEEGKRKKKNRNADNDNSNSRDMTAIPLGEAVVEDEKKKQQIGVTKVRVEPKVFFANERTFISWLQFCALLLTVALNLMNFATDNDTRIVGGIFMGLAACIAIYALYRFEKRAWYDDLWGPAVLCVLLVGALIVNFYLRFR
ncbi:VTC domain-domain-containing protein [Absidia repens]|uniref:Vacuolar transporter chaperone complex subunit 4 n=1 Tax=Absidia repens TaxID=90262 RepID=A0A1X2IM85_9FUNG|nr:VTC domain-domain-containing protein [Absidia repens]